MQEPLFIKCEAELLTDSGDTTECVPDLLLPFNGDKSADLKIEQDDVDADESLGGAGVSTIKEEFDIQDVKIETQDEACNTEIDTLQALENVAVVTRKPVHSCDRCCRTFKTTEALNRHSLTHSVDKPYHCSVCYSGFSKKHLIKKHLASHAVLWGWPVYSCDMCCKTFRTNCDLRRHFFSHSKERPFNCAECNYGFVQKSHLIKHLRTHGEGRPYICRICKCTFTERGYLKKHELIHIDEKRPYPCTVCPKAYFKKQSLKIHLLTHSPP